MRAIKLTPALQGKVANCHRGLQHFVHFEIPRHPINLVGGEIFTQLRVKYILKEISEDDWKQELQRTEKKNEKNIAYRHVFDMLVAVGTDMFRRISGSVTEKDVTAVVNEMETLRVFFNEAISKIANRFASSSSSKSKQLNVDWVYM